MDVAGFHVCRADEVYATSLASNVAADATVQDARRIARAVYAAAASRCFILINQTPLDVQAPCSLRAYPTPILICPVSTELAIKQGNIHALPAMQPASSKGCVLEKPVALDKRLATTSECRPSSIVRSSVG